MESRVVRVQEELAGVCCRDCNERKSGTVRLRLHEWHGRQKGRLEASACNRRGHFFQ